MYGQSDHICHKNAIVAQLTYIHIMLTTGTYSSAVVTMQPPTTVDIESVANEDQDDSLYILLIVISMGCFIVVCGSIIYNWQKGKCSRKDSQNLQFDIAVDTRIDITSNTSPTDEEFRLKNGWNQAAGWFNILASSLKMDIMICAWFKKLQMIKI